MSLSIQKITNVGYEAGKINRARKQSTNLPQNEVSYGYSLTKNAAKIPLYVALAAGLLLGTSTADARTNKRITRVQNNITQPAVKNEGLTQIKIPYRRTISGLWTAFGYMSGEKQEDWEKIFAKDNPHITDPNNVRAKTPINLPKGLNAKLVRANSGEGINAFAKRNGMTPNAFKYINYINGDKLQADRYYYVVYKNETSKAKQPAAEISATKVQKPAVQKEPAVVVKPAKVIPQPQAVSKSKDIISLITGDKSMANFTEEQKIMIKGIYDKYAPIFIDKNNKSKCPTKAKISRSEYQAIACSKFAEDFEKRLAGAMDYLSSINAAENKNYNTEIARIDKKEKDFNNEQNKKREVEKANESNIWKKERIDARYNSKIAAKKTEFDKERSKCLSEMNNNIQNATNEVLEKFKLTPAELNKLHQTYLHDKDHPSIYTRLFKR